MIIRATEEGFILIRQHDHAELSEQLARSLAPELLPAGARRADIIYAAGQHDRGWIGLDETPVWNDGENRPYTFEDYPPLPKIAFYTRGIDEVEAVSPYAGLLCSYFYSSFFAGMDDEASLGFRRREEVRQHRLAMNMRAARKETERDLKLLQLLDGLSLYVCLNRPEASGAEEHPWYRAGFAGSEALTASGKRLSAKWAAKERLLLSEKALQGTVVTTLLYKHVPHTLISEMGIAAAYLNCPLLTQTLEWSNPA
ncbi:DUF3891 family protein [Paenibacillus pasadenensis]|uniref:DUF3891 family protein n=1 Tax=Paenibacillus pasadenensis TaxID=217090 RepID=UPI00203D87B6|nr:DUF3891 family protein [Paenibacillus pasadenensis]MCM3747172.1 DUF3891 family protein [Paenibacillus pasadenensis]